jgi:hypothetical protein
MRCLKLIEHVEKMMNADPDMNCVLMVSHYAIVKGMAAHLHEGGLGGYMKVGSFGCFRRAEGGLTLAADRDDAADKSKQVSDNVVESTATAAATTTLIGSSSSSSSTTVLGGAMGEGGTTTEVALGGGLPKWVPLAPAWQSTKRVRILSYCSSSFFSCLGYLSLSLSPSPSLSRSIPASLHSLTPHGTSLTTVSSNNHFHLLLLRYRYHRGPDETYS